MIIWYGGDDRGGGVEGNGGKSELPGWAAGVSR